MTPQEWKHTWHQNRPRKTAITAKEAVGRAQAVSLNNGRRNSKVKISLAPLPEALREKR